MIDYFTKALQVLLGIEGEYVNDFSDHGGPTKYGITVALAIKYGFHGPIKELTLDLARGIYRQEFWVKQKCEEVSDWYEPCGLELFDTSVNMGNKTAAKFFQIALDVFNYNKRAYDFILIPDGDIGEMTLLAMNSFTKEEDKKLIVKIMNIQQGHAYLNICLGNETQEKFIKGWLSRVKYE